MNPEEQAEKITTPPVRKRRRLRVGRLLRRGKRLLWNWSWLPLLLLSFGIIAYYTVFPSRGAFHSDCTDTLMWALASHEGGSLFNPDFKYACLLPFGTSLMMQALIPLTGVTMTTHVLGMLLFAILYTAALIVMLRRLGCSWRWVAVCTGAELMLCSGSDKLREIFWGHTIYYSLDMLFLFVGLALIFRFLDAQDVLNRTRDDKDSARAMRGMLVSFVLTGIWFILIGTDQLISIAIVCLPLMAAVFAERWLDHRSKPVCLHNVQAACLLILMALGMGCGYLITDRIVKHQGVQALYEDAFSRYSAMSTWVEHIEKLPTEWFLLIGVKIAKEDPLMSIGSVKNLFIVITAVLLLVIPVIALCCYGRIRDRKLRVLILAYWFMTTVLMMGYIMGKLYTAKWRLSPMLAFSVIVTVMFLRWAIRQVEWQRVMTMAMIPVLLVCMNNGYQILKMRPDNRADNKLYKLCSALADEGLDYGYATFWNANGLTVVSDDAIRVRSVTIDEDGTFKPYYYQSLRTWFDDQPGQEEYFLLMEHAEELTMLRYHISLYRAADRRIAVGEDYAIWVFDHNIVEQTEEP